MDSVAEFQQFGLFLTTAMVEALYLQSVCLPPVTDTCPMPGDKIREKRLNESAAALEEVGQNLKAVESCLCPCKTLDFTMRMGRDNDRKSHEHELCRLGIYIEWHSAVGLEVLPRTFANYNTRHWDHLPRFYGHNIEFHLGDRFPNASLDLGGWNNGREERDQEGLPIEYVKQMTAKFSECDDHRKYFFQSTKYSTQHYQTSVGLDKLFDPSDLNHIGCNPYDVKLSFGGGYWITAKVKPATTCGVAPDGHAFCGPNFPEDCDDGRFCNTTVGRCEPNPTLFESCLFDGYEIPCSLGSCTDIDDTGDMRCMESCDSDKDCPSFEAFCSTSGMCVPKKLVGEHCDGSNECTDSYCDIDAKQGAVIKASE